MTDAIIDIDTMPITLDLAPIKVGSDYSFTIEILDDNEAVQNTTGWSMEIKGRANGTNGLVLFSLTTVASAGITHTPASGRFVVAISDTITLALTVNRVYWDCKVTDNNGDITYPFEGIFEVKQTVTR